MTVSRRLLGGVLAIVLTVSAVHQVECQLVLVDPSAIQNFLLQVNRIGKITLDLMSKPKLTVAGGVVPTNVLAQRNARRIRYLLNSLKRRRLIMAKARIPRRQTLTVPRRIPSRLYYRPIVFY